MCRPPLLQLFPIFGRIPSSNLPWSGACRACGPYLHPTLGDDHGYPVWADLRFPTDIDAHCHNTTYTAGRSAYHRQHGILQEALDH